MQEFMPSAIEFAQKHTLLTIAWIAIFCMVVYSFIQAASRKFRIISQAEMVCLINNDEAAVIDLRSLDEFQRGHIVNSINVLPTEIKSRNLGKIEHHKETPVVLVDVNGISAATSAASLVKQGFTKVYVLKDGISGWAGANFPLVKKK